MELKKQLGKLKGDSQDLAVPFSNGATRRNLCYGAEEATLLDLKSSMGPSDICSKVG